MLSSILSDEERFAETQPVMERVVEIAKAVYGPQDKETARRIGELGIIHHMQGPDHADDTEMQYISALKIMKKLIQQNELSPTDWDYLYLLSNLANLYAQIGKNVEAEATVKKVLEYKRMSPEKDTPRKVLPDLRLLAQIYQDQDKRDEAEGTYIEVLKIEEATFGKDSAELCPTLNNMGAFYCQQESWNTAEPLLKRAKALLLTEETPDLEGLMSTSRNLIGVYAHTNRPVEAEEEYNWLLGLCQRHNLPDPFAED
jgi:tetratricopeptide (TPR) repeat protein